MEVDEDYYNENEYDEDEYDDDSVENEVKDIKKNHLLVQIFSLHNIQRLL